MDLMHVRCSTVLCVYKHFTAFPALWPSYCSFTPVDLHYTQPQSGPEADVVVLKTPEVYFY